MKLRLEIDSYRGTKRWYNEKDELHNDDGPAVEFGPAASEMDQNAGTKCWYQNGELHREGGPAIEHLDGRGSWFKNGWPHRTDGPAHFDEWYVNGKRIHNVNEIIKLHDLNPDWTQWTDAEKVLFRLAV